MLKASPPRGLSLIELLIVLAILGVAGGALSRIATHHQRAYGRLALRTLAGAQLRDGADVLAAGLAGLAPAAGDIYPGGMNHAAIEFRAPLASALLCEGVPPGARELDLAGSPPVDDAHDDGDRPFRAPSVVPGDSLLLYDASADTAGAESAWSAHAVVAAVNVRRPCPPLDTLPRPIVRASIIPEVRGAPESHAPVRIFRRARYALYRAGDGKAYLGFRDCLPLSREPACAPLQPVAGPYMADAGPRATDRGGLTLEYLDAAGRPVEDAREVATIVATLRAHAGSQAAPADTAVVQRIIGLRNAPR